MKTRMLRDIEVSEVGMDCKALKGFREAKNKERIIENLD